MLTTITETTYSHAALLNAVNSALSEVNGFEPTKNLAVIQGLLKHYPKISDELYASAGATMNSKWMASVWSLCGRSPEEISRGIVGLKDSAPVLKGVLKHATDPDAAANMANVCAKRNDHIAAVELLGAGAITKKDFSQGLSKLNNPVLFALKVHSFGVIDPADLFDIVRRNSNHSQITLYLQSVQPNKAVLNWASQRYAESKEGFKQLIKLAVSRPNLAGWAADQMQKSGGVSAAFNMFRIGQACDRRVKDLKIIKAFNDAMPIDTLERIVLKEVDVDIAMKLVEFGFSDASLSAEVVRKDNRLDEVYSEHPDLQDDNKHLYEALLGVDVKPETAPNIRLFYDDVSNDPTLDSKSSGVHGKKPVLHSLLAPD